jgi:cell division transport system ATP-binding protein
VTGAGGAGKTTLLRLVYGAETPTGGQVLVDGAEVARLPGRGLCRLRRGCGILPAEPRVLPDRTVFGDLALVLRALGFGRAETRERALEALGEVGLGGRRNALTAELAEGERARLCLARALVGRPRLLIVDEPTARLDGPATGFVLGLLRRARDLGTTVLVATRSGDLARQLDGRTLVLAGGRLAPETVPA